jgi:hypothetical protein
MNEQRRNLMAVGNATEVARTGGSPSITRATEKAAYRRAYGSPSPSGRKAERPPSGAKPRRRAGDPRSWSDWRGSDV